MNEYSTRYTEAIDECQTTCPGSWRIQSGTNRQGSSGAFVSEWPEGYHVLPCYEDETNITDPNELVAIDEDEHQFWGVYKLSEDDASNDAEHDLNPLLKYFFNGPRSELTPGLYLSAMEQKGQVESRDLYNERLDFEVAKEQARKDLPLSTMTKAVWKCDLRNIFHFLGLRMHGHAQYEIRMFANAMGKIVEMLYPVAYQAFLDFELNSMKLSALDIEVIRSMAGAAISAPYPEEFFYECVPAAWKGEKCGERAECLAKLRLLGLVVKPA